MIKFDFYEFDKNKVSKFKNANFLRVVRPKHSRKDYEEELSSVEIVHLYKNGIPIFPRIINNPEFNPLVDERGKYSESKNSYFTKIEGVWLHKSGASIMKGKINYNGLEYSGIEITAGEDVDLIKIVQEYYLPVEERIRELGISWDAYKIIGKPVSLFR